jgi:hypothetical protein
MIGYRMFRRFSPTVDGAGVHRGFAELLYQVIPSMLVRLGTLATVVPAAWLSELRRLSY